jgi:Tol biopolymer transport system component
VAIPSQLTWFERSGERASTLGEQADWVDVALSPDGSRVALSKADPDSLRDIWLLDVHRALAERFTSAAADDFAPVWSPTGDRLIFSSTREGRVDLFWKSQAAEDEQRIPDGGLALGKFAASWSPDGKSILFIAGGRSIARSDLMTLPVVGGTAEAFADSPLVETQARFSPDGRWVALAMNTSGRLEVYVKPYGRPGNATRISLSGGRWPRWRRDGQELVFLSPDETLMSASIRLASETVAVDGVKPLFKVRLRPQVRLDSYPYDMTPDAQRFLVNSFAEEPNASSPVTLVINWPELLKK